MHTAERHTVYCVFRIILSLQVVHMVPIEIHTLPYVSCLAIMAHCVDSRAPVCKPRQCVTQCAAVAVFAHMDGAPAVRRPRRLGEVNVVAGRRSQLQQHVAFRQIAAAVFPNVIAQLLGQRLIHLEAILHPST